MGSQVVELALSRSCSGTQLEKQKPRAEHHGDLCSRRPCFLFWPLQPTSDHRFLFLRRGLDRRASSHLWAHQHKPAHPCTSAAFSPAKEPYPGGLGTLTNTKTDQAPDVQALSSSFLQWVRKWRPTVGRYKHLSSLLGKRLSQRNEGTYPRSRCPHLRSRHQ